MSHETKDIAKTKSLSFSLQHMRTRHEFLIRAGLFKPLQYRKLIKILEKDRKENMARQNYFSPLEIICFRDADFLQACTKGRLSVNEYAAFEEIYASELKNIEYDDQLMSLLNEDDEDEENSDTGGTVQSTNSQHFANAAENKDFYF